MSDSETPEEEVRADSPAASETAVTNGPAEASEESRRGLLIQGITAVLSFLLVAVPSTLAGIFYLDPILRKKKGGGDEEGDGGDEFDGFIQLPVTLDALPEDGQPVSVTVKDTLDDAWNRFRDVPVGSVWLRRLPENNIIAFNSICPHLGCSVNYRSGENDFFCPCHTSSFDLDGNKTNEVPPRDMDSLEIKLGPDNQSLWLRYRNFRGATADKIEL